MTETTYTALPSPTTGPSQVGNPHPMRRIWNVTRLNVVNKWTVFWIPLMILSFIWLMSVAIWWIIDASVGGPDQQDALEGTTWSGSAFYIFVYALVLAVQSMNSTFAYALGLSVSRREFYLGSSLAFVLISAAYGALLTTLSFLEEWTNGWGVGGHMFTSVYFGSGPLWQRFLDFTVSMLFFSFLGALIGTIFIRWRGNGLLLASAVTAALLLGCAALITLSQSWPAVGAWLVASGSHGVVMWTLIPTAIAAISGYFILNRATPNS
jgi:hypothetical protein